MRTHSHEKRFVELVACVTAPGPRSPGAPCRTRSPGLAESRSTSPAMMNG
ncbi:hypothetical protein [Promicromonospora xylanilytica]